MTNEIFIVVKEGVYRHEIIGAFDNFLDAVDTATKAINRERDSYHEFAIYKFYLNEQTDDGIAVHRISRKKPNSKEESK